MPLVYMVIIRSSNWLAVLSYFLTIRGSNSPFLSLGMFNSVSPYLVLMVFLLEEKNLLIEMLFPVGDDHLRIQKILAGLVWHPNAGGVLVMGLGCENNNIEEFKRVLGPYDPERVKFLAIQEVENEINAGLKVLEELVAYAEGFTYTPVPVGCLKVGLKCGGSDAFSDITVNPLVGVFLDLLVKQGGITMLTEVPEMFGAETIL